MPLELFLRGNIWHVRGTVRGQPCRESTEARKDRKDLAEAYRAKREAELFENAIFGRRDPVEFRYAATAYLKFTPPSQRTVDYTAQLVDHFDCKFIDGIGQVEADAAVTAIVGDDAAPATKVRNVYTPLIAILNFAATRQWCAPPNFQKPKPPRGKTRWLTPAEAEALIVGAAPHLKPLLIFMLGTGVRVSEALDLDWADVDLFAGKVVLRDTKNSTDRVARLPPAAWSAIATLASREGRVFRTDDGSPYVDRERWEGGQIKKAFGTACKRAQITGATPHTLRHTFASWFYCLSKDLLLLKDEGGWKTLTMVERYAHLVPSELAPQIAKVWGGDHPRISTPATQPLTAQAKTASIS